jgi:Fe(3+) dicitrate transport protein
MNRIFTTLTASLVCMFGVAQGSKIEGVVFQQDSINALPGVSIYLEKTNYGTMSNGTGSFSLIDVPAGSYTLVVSNMGYARQKKQISIKENETLKINFVLVESVSKLEELVVMTNGNSGLREIPGSVYYLSPKELQKFAYTDINRTLRTIPGVNLQEEDGYGLRTNIGLRGTGVERSSKITIMEDGILMAPAPYAEPAAYYFPTIGRMQGVEVMKGSSQIKYGPYTTGGAINLISTQIPDDFSGRVSLWGGSYGGRNVHAYVGNAHKNVAYMVETFQYGANGFKELDGGGNTGFDKKDYLAKIRVNTNPDAKIYQSLTLKAGQATEVSNETYLGLTQADFDKTPFRKYAAAQEDVMTTSQMQFSATHLARFTKNISLTTSAYRADFSRNWYKLDKVKDSTGTKTSIGDLLDAPSEYDDAYAILTGQTSTNDDALFVKANNRAYYLQGVQTALNVNFTTGKIAHNIDLGARYHQDQSSRIQWEDAYAMNDGSMLLTKAASLGSESNRTVSATAFASYLQYKLKYGKFTATPGVRYENIYTIQKDYGKNDPERKGTDLKETENTIDMVIPGIGLDYQFNKHTSAFMGVHKGFTPPGFKEETLPEESINYELGSRYVKNATSIQAVVFFNDYKNLLGSDLAASGGLGTGEMFNAGEVQTKGLELMATYDVLGKNNQSRVHLPITLSYTYTDAIFKNSFVSSFEEWGTVTNGDYFPYMSNHQLALVLGVEHNKFNVNVSGRYNSAMRTLPSQGAVPAENLIPAYMLLDASVNYNLSSYISLFGSVTNITNAAYLVARRPAGLRPGMPRAFNIGLRANF